jgi:hypothetical protein
MWVDTIARRRAGRPPNVKHWFPLGEALTVFVNADLHSALAAARQRAADTQELGVRLWGQMEDIKKKQSLADSLNSFDLESDFMSLSRQRRKAEIQMPIDEQEVTAAQRRIDRFLFDKLAAGRLLARGLPYRNHIISDEIEIPSAFWRVMVIDRNDKELQTVGGNGALYVGVRVGQPS